MAKERTAGGDESAPTSPPHAGNATIRNRNTAALSCFLPFAKSRGTNCTVGNSSSSANRRAKSIGSILTHTTSFAFPSHSSDALFDSDQDDDGLGSGKEGSSTPLIEPCDSDEHLDPTWYPPRDFVTQQISQHPSLEQEETPQDPSVDSKDSLLPSSDDPRQDSLSSSRTGKGAMQVAGCMPWRESSWEHQRQTPQEASSIYPLPVGDPPPLEKHPYTSSTSRSKHDPMTTPPTGIHSNGAERPPAQVQHRADTRRKPNGNTSLSFDSTNSSGSKSISSASPASIRSPAIPSVATLPVNADKPPGLGVSRVPRSVSSASGSMSKGEARPSCPAEGVHREQASEAPLSSARKKLDFDKAHAHAYAPPAEPRPSTGHSLLRNPVASLQRPLSFSQGHNVEQRPRTSEPRGRRLLSLHTGRRVDAIGCQFPEGEFSNGSIQEEETLGGLTSPDECASSSLEHSVDQTKFIHKLLQGSPPEDTRDEQGKKDRSERPRGWLQPTKSLRKSPNWFKAPKIPLRNYSLKPGLLGRAPTSQSGNPLQILGTVMNSQGKPDFHEHFQLGKVLGEGSYGSVRECVSKRTGTKYACKVVRKERLLRPKDMLQARMEYFVQKKVSLHPNIVHVEDMYEDSKHLYIVMELCDGGDLFDSVTKARGLDEGKAAAVFLQLLSAVKLCHSNEVLHRDIKLENVLVCRSHLNAGPKVPPISSDTRGRRTPSHSVDYTRHTPGNRLVVKLADFGSALLLPKGEKAGGRTGGSKMYQAPEVLNREKYDYKADMWSLGVVLYALLSSTFPFTAPTEALLSGMIKRGVFHMTGSKWDYVSPQAKEVVGMLLKVDPQKRASLEDVLAHPWVVHHSAAQEPQATAVSRSKSFRTGSDSGGLSF